MTGVIIHILMTRTLDPVIGSCRAESQEHAAWTKICEDLELNSRIESDKVLN